MNQQNPLLDTMKDVQLPETISQLPVALGWWILLLLVVVIISTIFIVVRRYLRQKRTLAKLTHEINQLEHHENWPLQLTLFMKQCVITFLPQSNAQQMTGSNWKKWLVASAPPKHKAMFKSRFESLTDLQYQPNTAAQLQFSDYQPLLVSWLKYLIKKQSNNQYRQATIAASEAKDV